MTEYIGEWTTVDKSAWGPGPWQDEPDKVHWIDGETNLDCLMVRQPRLGHWCGYVGVTEGHPAFEQDYDKPDVEIHGGLTFASLCSESADPAEGICHVPQHGRPDRVWWLGFDCAHASDLAPAMAARERARYEETHDPVWARSNAYFDQDVYRDRAYVEDEVRNLARQLAAMAVPA